MNKDSEPSPQNKPDYNPHAADLSKRDWTIIGYFACLGIIPLVVIIFVIYALVNNSPNFDNFPDPPQEKPLPYRSEVGSTTG